LVRDEFIKVKGRYLFKIGDQIKGKITGVISDVNSVIENKSRFKV
jgi:hypothetical protein